MRDICDKEVEIDSDNEWIVMSSEDAMVMLSLNALKQAMTSINQDRKIIFY